MKAPPASLARARQRLVLAYLRLDQALVAAGWHPTSAWWLRQLTRWAATGARQWVICVGRRGGKSSFLARLAVAQALFGECEAPAGDTLVCAFLSVKLEEAKARLKTVREILEVIGESCSFTADKVRLPHRSLEFRALAASEKSAVGFTACLIVADELATWEEHGATAAQVLDKIAPSMGTVPQAFLVASSAPAGTTTHHHRLVLEGDTDYQIVSGPVASWIANDSLTEEQCRALASSEVVFDREWRGIASDNSTAPALDREAILYALSAKVPERQAHQIGRYVIATDLATGTGGDAAVWLAAAWHQTASGDRVLVVAAADGQRGPFAHTTTPGEIVRTRVKATARAYDAEHVFGDGHLAPLAEEACRDVGLRWTAFGITADAKADAVAKLALMLTNRQLILPIEHGWLRRELLAYQAKVSKTTGKTRYEGRGRQHDDMVGALIVLMLADSRGLVEGSIGARIKRRDPLPFAGGKLESWGWARPPTSAGAPQVVIDQATGRAYVRRGPGGGSALGGGGF